MAKTKSSVRGTQNKKIVVVKPYVKSNGTRVSGHRRSTPNQVEGSQRRPYQDIFDKINEKMSWNVSPKCGIMVSSKENKESQTVAGFKSYCRF